MTFDIGLRGADLLDRHSVSDHTYSQMLEDHRNGVRSASYVCECCDALTNEWEAVTLLVFHRKDGKGYSIDNTSETDEQPIIFTPSQIMMIGDDIWEGRRN